MDAMNKISITSGLLPQRTERDSPAGDGSKVEQKRTGDVVDISPAALRLSRGDDVSDVRAGLVDRVRAEIAAESYQTNDKMGVAIDRLFSDLAGFDERA